MSFATEVLSPNAPQRILLEIDVDQINTQWINEGAGIWSVNTSNIYNYVDPSLLSSNFTVQNFGDIGSVKVDTVEQTQVTSLSVLTSATQQFYYDTTAKTLYLHVINNDEVFLHIVSLGVSNGFSNYSFTPIGSNSFYDGRITSIPSISINRDPLTFGKIQFAGGGVTLNNSDGYFDLWGDSKYIYGNEARIYVGFADLTRSEYQIIYTGFVGKLSIGIDKISVDIQDKRKQLSKKITYTCTALNGLSAISAIITSAYSTITYDSTFYDTTEWAVAQASAPTVTITMQTPDDVINVIQGICLSVFGTLIVKPDGRYTFKSIDPDASASILIPQIDILDYQTFDYDPNNAYSSVRVGYNRNWTTTNNPYSYITNTSSESAFYNKYKTYQQKDFLTYLTGTTSPTALGVKINNYVDTVYSTFSITTGFSYYSLEIADMIYVELARPDSSETLGYRKCEVLGVQYNLNELTITFNLRAYSDTLTLLGDENGNYIASESSFIGV